MGREAAGPETLSVCDVYEGWKWREGWRKWEEELEESEEGGKRGYA